MKDLELQAERAAFEAWFREAVGVSFEGAKQRGAWDLDLIESAYKAGRTAVEANSVPDGWKPVPVEPTPEMLNAANVQAQKEFARLGLGDGSRIDASKAAANYYRAMLSASPAPAQQERKPMTDAASDVLAERQRQISAEGWTPEHDDEHAKGEMAAAAACYALHTEPVGNVGNYLRFWPWAAKWWKPADRRRNLVKAGALIVAEIERLDRAAERHHGIKE